MFDEYLYFSSYSDTVIATARESVESLIRRFDLGEHSLAVEIASNDGYLLRNYLEHGVPAVGIEPATNIATVARERGIETINAYFTADLAQRLVADGRAASVVHANNVMAHVPNINDFLAGISIVLREGGTAVVESPYVVHLVDEWQFDTIYHEHVFYYSVTAVIAWPSDMAWRLVDVEPLPIHGGSLRYFLQRGAAHPSAAVAQLLEEERRRGVDQPAYFDKLQHRVSQLRDELTSTLTALKRDGASIAAYGAAAKGTVLLNHFGIDSSLVDFVVDRNEHKQGRYMPGVGIPIRPVEALLEESPDFTVILAWNFADEILRQQIAYREAGGRFIVPAPTVRVL